MTLLGEMKSISGEMRVQGSVFYVQQEPWVFSASLRQNILFGKPYVKDKFNAVVRACSLEQDLKLMEQGERTLIGEKGINLSGGQRARLGLARALYSDAQILLLDDPLSAVDASVAKHLFSECINGYMKNKTRVLVTHQVHHLTQVDKILLLEDGRVKAQGSFDEIMSQGIDVNSLMQHDHEAPPPESPRSPLESVSLSRRRSRADSTRSAINSIAGLNDELEVEAMGLSSRNVDSQHGSVSGLVGGS